MDKRDIESSYYYPEIIFLGDGRVAMQMEITLNYTEEDDEILIMDGLQKAV